MSTPTSGSSRSSGSKATAGSSGSSASTTGGGSTTAGETPGAASGAGRPGGSAPAGSSSSAVPGQRRRARLIVSRVDPLTVAKVSLVLATGLAIAFLVSIIVLWVLFQTAGVFDTVSRTINDVAGSQIDAQSLVSFPRLFGIALLLSVVQVVLTSALATLVSMLYNLAAYFVGGISVTLTED